MSDLKQTTEDSRPVVLLAAVAAALIGAFVYYRTDDLLKLPSLIGNLGGTPFIGSGIIDSLAGAIIAFLLLAAWFGLGSVVMRLVQLKRAERHSHVLEAVITTAAGAAAWSLVWFLLGVAGLYSPAAAIVSLAAGIACAIYGSRRLREARDESEVPGRPSAFDRVIIGIIAVPVALAFVASLAPPTAKDTLLYHFALPKAFIAQGSNAFVDGNIASYLALGAEMHAVWAMLLGGVLGPRAGEAAAGAALWLFLPLLLGAIFGWAREIDIPRKYALLAVMLVASVPTVFHVASSGYIDIALSLYVTLAAYGLCRWWADPSSGSLGVVALMLGAALAIKLTALFAFAAFALVILLRGRTAANAAKLVGSAIGALLLAAVIASPTYVRTWGATGSPVFPFYMNIWPGRVEGWDLERSELFQEMNRQYGDVAARPGNYLLAPLRLSTTAQPEDHKQYDGVLGAAFLIGLIFLIWASLRGDLPVEAKIAASVSAILFIFWLFTSEQLRYLLPFLPMLSVAIAAGFRVLDDADRRTASIGSYSLIAASAAAVLTGTAWFALRAPVRVVLGGESRDAFLSRNLDYYKYYDRLNTSTGADEKVWLINMRRDTYNLDRPYFSDYLFEDWTLKRLLWESGSAREIRSKASAMGLRYILVRHDFLIDYEHSSLVDDKRERQENEAKLKIVRELLLDPAKVIMADDRFSLVKIY
ncbi:MAG: glycosyltransferase family 39 protein [Acidobacteria bacterium]|nr:glycosyltransferase family 39 protein [Acidobacteriota bacterium]MCW5948521.1 glycosyltransferase family 39 protein [Pyrinomonadaceae bacterium]